MKAILHFLVRWQACRLVADAITGSALKYAHSPDIWFLAQFFEEYMLGGKEATADRFGPRVGVVLKVAVQDGKLVVTPEPEPDPTPPSAA